MWKYLAALIMVFGLAFIVARQDQHAADQAAHKTADAHKAAVVTNPNEQHPQENIENPSRDGPRWYVLCLYSLFRWHNGTTTWAIILTLLAIAEQTRHTARATDIANRTLNATLRPKLIVRRIRIHWGTDIPISGQPDKDPWRIDFDIVNIGKGTCRIVGHHFNSNRIKDEFPDFWLEERAVPHVKLAPGEKHSVSIPMLEELVVTLRHIGINGLTQGWQGTNRLFFWGNAQYIDASNVRREVSVCRLYNNKAGRFKPTDDPDYEYPD